MLCGFGYMVVWIVECVVDRLGEREHITVTVTAELMTSV